jgi:23S rRNA pseudouridine1911/1915/1917 synthase
VRSLTVPSGAAPLRLDLFLTSHVPSCSRRRAQRAIAAGEVRLNGKRTRKGATVGDGDVVQVADALYELPVVRPNPRLALRVVYADAELIAIDKPAGMPSHALRPEETETVANFLLARYPELAAVGRNGLEPGIVHRLDTDTSGVLLAARTPAAYQALRRQFAAHRVTKEYLALVDGEVTEPGELHAPIRRAGRNPGVMRVCTTPDARTRPAGTAYRPIERLGPRTLLEVRILTGVMHQIRVHLASIGHPIVGDRVYGVQPAPPLPHRQLLHACRVALTHPRTGKLTHISAPLPPDFAALLEDLRKAQRPPRG